MKIKALTASHRVGAEEQQALAAYGLQLDARTMSDEQFEGLLGLVELEFEDALKAYGLQFDNKTMGRTACFARLGPTREGLWVGRRGERLLQAIDRKRWVITRLLQGTGLAQCCGSKESPDPAREDPPSPR